MGPKASREQQHHHHHKQRAHHHRHHDRSFVNNENYYSNTVLSYAIMDHGIPLTSNDISRVTAQEIQNLQKHNQTRFPATSEISDKQAKSMSISSSNYHLEKKQPRFEQHIQNPKLGIRKSRAFNDVSDTNSIVTVQQLIDDQVKRRRRNKSSSSQISTYSSQSSNLDKSTSSTSLSQSSTSKKRRKKIPDDFTFVSINPKDLQNAHEIGKGHFGTVYRAVYKGALDVAIKTLHSQDGNTLEGTVDDYDENMRELLHEAHIMTRLKHANLLRIIGVTFFGNRQRLSIVTDFMKNGSLLDYLRKHRDIFLRSDSRMVTMKLNKFSLQIFEAMCYLEERKIIHRDLAARNCLIGESDTLKVGDFGLTTLTDCGLYKGTYESICAPRWTSPEAIFSSKYSSRSDVWSYGITLWEIYTLGERPFGDMSSFAVKIILKNSSENLSRHLTKPRHFGSDETYTHIILPCLTHNVTMRPRFKDLRERLTTILADRTQ